MTLHGHSVAYRQAGSGPVVVLVHGITSSSATWERVIGDLARRFTVIAPDLAGHGESDKPKGDYSLGAHASTVRDLLLALGHERATFVGHSLGGGIAMQLAYQFPERCERLVLVDSGGLGREVSLLLRAATLPGSELVLPFLTATRLLDAGARVGSLLGRFGPSRSGTDLRGERPRPRDARGRRGARGVPPHASLGRRARRTAGRRHRPALPGRAGPVPAVLGRARLAHPGVPRTRSPRAAARQPPGGLRSAPATFRNSTSPSGSWRC